MENNQRNSRKRLNSLILLVAFTAVMLIVSTYAWFSTQKNVTLSGIEGKVKVAEGLQISLDASIWKNEIDFSDFTNGGASTSATYFAATGATLANPLASGSGNSNVIPSFLLPASTTGADAYTDTLTMYRGSQESGLSLENIAAVNEDANDPDKTGYYAIDLYLQNSSAGTGADVLQLEPNSSVTIGSADKSSTGLQNTVRVALAITDLGVPVDGSKGQSEILGATGNDISKVAIWEPNSKSHSGYVQKNQRLATKLDGGKYTWGPYIEADTQHYTYAVNSSAVGEKIDNVYYWNAGETKLTETKTLQTDTTVGAKTNFVEAKTGGNVTINANQYVKARLYIWLEGQDVDCINQASYGGKVNIEFGFSKPGTENS